MKINKSRVLPRLSHIKYLSKLMTPRDRRRLDTDWAADRNYGNGGGGRNGAEGRGGVVGGA